MAICRTYQCDDCTARLGRPFRFDKLHFDRNEPPPECPGCQALEAKQVPAVFHMNGRASQAGDIAQEVLEKDYGMTNIRDNMREGDLAVVTPPHLRPALDGFFKGSGEMIAAARAGAKIAKAEGSNPLTIIQKAAKMRGTASVPISPVNKVR